MLQKVFSDKQYVFLLLFFLIGIDQSLPMGYDFVHYSIQRFDVQCILIVFFLKIISNVYYFLISSFMNYTLHFCFP